MVQLKRCHRRVAEMPPVARSASERRTGGQEPQNNRGQGEREGGRERGRGNTLNKINYAKCAPASINQEEITAMSARAHMICLFLFNVRQTDSTALQPTAINCHFISPSIPPSCGTSLRLTCGTVPVEGWYLVYSAQGRWFREIYGCAQIYKINRNKVWLWCLTTSRPT